MHCGPSGYLGISAVEGGVTNVTGLFKVDRTLKGSRAELIAAYLQKNGCYSMCERLLSATPVEHSFAATAGFDFGRQDTFYGFCLGDRATLIPPFSGNGMSMALEAASHARGPLLGYLEGRWSWEQACRQQAEFTRKAFRLRMWLATKLQRKLVTSIGLHTLAVVAQSGLLPTRFLVRALR